MKKKEIENEEDYEVEADEIEADEIEEVSPVDAVIDELDLGDKQKEEEAPPPPVKAEKNGITDADLEPLTTKNVATNERFQKITEGYKQERETSNQLRGEIEKYQTAFTSLKNLGFSDEKAGTDLVQFADFRKVVQTGDVDKFQQVIAAQIQNFESLHGKRVNVSASGMDLFPDLRQRVDKFDIDEETALELARSRNLENRIRSEREQQNQIQQSNQARENSISMASDAVNQLQNYWKSNDPDFAVIMKHISKEEVAEMGQRVDPRLWPEIIANKYQTIKNVLARQKPQPRQYQPLRASSQSTNRAVPSNPVDAVLQEFGFDD